MSPRHRPPACPIHERVLICPACVGARGGAVGGRASSPKKTRAARRNARRPRPGASLEDVAD